MIRNPKFAVSLGLAFALAGCSANVSTQPALVGSAPAQLAPGQVPVTHNDPHAGGQHPGHTAEPLPPMVTHCDSLNGSYQMNMESFTLSQEGCGKLTWTYAPQMSFGDDDQPVRDEHGMPVMSPERKDMWQLNGEEHDGERSYFVADGKRLLVEKDDGSKEVYFVAADGICDLYNPQGSYLVMETYAADDVNLSSRVGCKFWARH